MIADNPPKRFPRWRRWWRYFDKTEDMLGSLPMVIVTPVMAAAVAAAWTASLPTREVVRRGAVVAQSSFWHGLFVAVLGVGVGAGIAVLAAAVWCIVSYNLRGDPAWKVRWEITEQRVNGAVMRRGGVALVCESDPPVDVVSLGYVDAVLRPPGGEHRWMPQHGMGNGESGWWFHAANPSGPIPLGTYEVRWYGTTRRHRRFEIARSKNTVREGPDGIH